MKSLYKINLPTNYKVSYAFTENSKKILILKNTESEKDYFFTISKNIQCLYKDHTIILENKIIKSSSIDLDNLYKSINKFFYSEKKYKVFLTLTGLGYKVTKTLDNRLDLKIGKSHPTLIKIPDSVEVLVTNKYIILESLSKIDVKNFGDYLKRQKPTDAYKGKGFNYKYVTLNLKNTKSKQ